MDYSLQLSSLLSYIERSLISIDYKELEKKLGLSYRHIRRIFKESTTFSLSRYILSRKIAHAALEVVLNKRSLTEIAYDYGFNSYDSFSRAFRRETGMVPSDFRKGGYVCGRRRIVMGVYGPIIPGMMSKVSLPIISEDKMMKQIQKSQDSCVLYGVTKVYYGRNYECTPFPMCLQSVLSYLGQNIYYAYLLVSSGAAFRLRWNVEGWDMAAVDIRNVFTDKEEAFRRAFLATGRECTILGEDKPSEEYISLIKTEIDNGRPLIALGVVGPPEACIITGYMDNGDTLLGWSLFQENMEFAGAVDIDDSGYFISRNWKNNIQGLMAVGEEFDMGLGQKEILETAVSILKTERLEVNEGQSTYLGGQAAYKAWANALTDETEFPDKQLLPDTVGRLMSQGDAEVMVGEGRSFAAGYIEWLGETYPKVQKECEACAKEFKKVAECVQKMMALRGDLNMTAENAKLFVQKEIRMKTAELVMKASKHEQNACGIIEDIIAKL